MKKNTKQTNTKQKAIKQNKIIKNTTMKQKLNYKMKAQHIQNRKNNTTIKNTIKNLTSKKKKKD